MSLGTILLNLITGGAARRFEVATKNPAATQEQLLMSMIRRNADTVIGRKYGFDKIHSIADYQRQVPVHTYEDLRPYMDRTVAGEKAVLTAESPILFAQTSGTTGKPKYIPVTPTCRSRVHGDVSKTWINHTARDHPGIASGKIFAMVSPAVEGYTDAGVPFGSTSGHMYKNMHPLIRRRYTVPYPLLEIKDYQAKYYAIMRVALEDDVAFLNTANPSSILKMCEKANEFAEDIVRDIRDGTLSETYDIEPEIREFIENRCKRRPQIAARLEAGIARRNGVLKPADYWPHLCLIGCWKGGTVGHYLEKFPYWFYPDGEPEIPTRDWGYLSSEARGSVPLSSQGSRGVLTVASNFMEFVDVEQLESNREDSSTWDFLTISELTDGQEYYIFFTTTSGLYRYDINDVIRVEGLYQATPQIVFCRKGRGMTNITGEKVSVNQIICAMQTASEAMGAMVSHFRAEADTRASRYVIRVEFIQPLPGAQRPDFLRQIDNHLKSINIEYKAKRDSLRLKAPILHVMREGWYERERQKQVATGKRAFQAKTQVLSPQKQVTMDIRPELDDIVELDHET